MRQMPRRGFLEVLGAGAAWGAAAERTAAAEPKAAVPRAFVCGREDGRFLHTAGYTIELTAP